MPKMLYYHSALDFCLFIPGNDSLPHFQLFFIRYSSIDVWRFTSKCARGAIVYVMGKLFYVIATLKAKLIQVVFIQCDFK